MDKKLPLYEMMIGDTIEGEEEVDFIALVEYPAIQKNFLAFRSVEMAKVDIIVCDECGHSWDYEEGGKDPYTCHLCGADNSKKESVGFNKFSIENQDQRIVTGALMIADLPIYRRDEDEEYYVSFSAAEIKKIVQRFFKKGYQSKVNVEHSTPVDGVYMFESFIINREKGIMPPKGFEDISNGSWFGSFKVDNEKIWNEVKAGTFKGFSVEGLFRYEKTNKVITQEEEIMSQIFKILGQIEH